MTLELAAGILSGALGVLLAALLVVQWIRYFGLALWPRAPLLRRFGGWLPAAASPLGGAGRAMLLSLTAFIASRAFFLCAAGLWALYTGELSVYLGDLPGRWMRWDAQHYVGLIENWYVNSGDPRFHIVFFPLYPLLGRLLHLATGLSARACAYLLSNACLWGSGCALYGVLRMGQGERAARKGVWLMMFCPVSFFLSAPFTESAFLLTTLLAVYFARRRKFVLAVLFGALSANARMLGMATAIPIFWEMLSDARDRAGSGRELAGRTAMCVLRVLPVSLGLGAYLLLNRAVTGDWLTFLTYQAEHWGQSFGSAMNTLRYTLVNALTYANRNYRVGVWIPQAGAIICVAALMAVTWRGQHPGDAAYALVYFYCAVAPTWLLSGTRYLGAMYALFPMLTLLTRRRWAYAAVLALEMGLGAYMGALYAVTGAIM